MPDKVSHPYFFSLGFKGLFKILGVKRVLKSWNFKGSLVASAGLTGFCAFLDSDCHKYFSELVDISLALFPSLIGFALAGYAIVIGSGSQLVLDKTLHKEPEDKFTLYQVTNSVWGFILLVNVITLLVSFIFKIFAHIDAESEFTPPFIVAKIYNIVGIFILLFLSIYSILLHIRMVRLIFDYGQKLFFFASEPKMDDQEREKSVFK